MEEKNDEILGEYSNTQVQEIKTVIKYDKNDFISGPERVENGTVPLDILVLYHSYGYDCQKYFNMCVPDSRTIIFASGSLLHFFDTQTREVTFLRGSTGRGIGHVAKNPVKNHIAVGENGTWPPIIIYEWPSMEIIRVLWKGTLKSYTHLAYNSDGNLLVSQGGEPDYSITIWDWKSSKIMLRCKSHSQDVYNAIFSPSVPEHLTTSGAGHVKFWKMSKTFTGLKLKGEIGRFGGTEISDVIGFYSMPDEKVITGCEWGNILVWEEGLIKVEVRRKNKISCHKNMITQFEFINGELMSIGMDGWIRVWYYETIDQADPPEDDRFIEVEPIYEFQINKSPGKNDDNENNKQEKSMLMGIMRVNTEEFKDTLWYAQDYNGGFWLIDLNTMEIPELPKKLLTCHAGAITDMSVCTWDFFVATCGKDGHLHVYNYLTKKLIIIHQFWDAGSKVIWLPCSVESSGTTIICAFESGIVRIVSVDVSGANKICDPEENKFVKLVQVVKPHTAVITAMSFNKSENILVTGSEDKTIFIFLVKISSEFPSLTPVGFIRVPSGISCMTWHPKNPLVILLGCSKGECAEVELPNELQTYTTISYELKIRPKLFKFVSVKSEIRCEIVGLEIEKLKDENRDKMMKKMENYKAANPGIEIDEETFLMDIEEYPPLPEIYIPEIPNPVLMINYIEENKIWLWMGGFDAGYIYEYENPDSEIIVEKKPTKSVLICDADDTEIYTYLIQNEEYLYLGMQHGEIRICRINKNDPTDLSDYLLFPMHDSFSGKIAKISLSHDEKMLLTCGWDSNLFSFGINEDSLPKKEGEQPTASSKVVKKNVDDIVEANHPSLEEVLKKAENDRILSLATEKKDKTLAILNNLSEEFRGILDRNKKLLKSQQLKDEDFELDPRITEDLDNQLKAEMDLVHEKMAFQVEKSRLGLQKLMDHFIKPITCLPFSVSRISKPDTRVHSLRERILGEDFTEKYAEVVRKIEEKKKKIRSLEVKSVDELEDEEEVAEIQEMESFLKGLSPETIQYKLGVRINQMLRKYRDRKSRIEQRAQEWKMMQGSKPDPNIDQPEDISAIEEAKKTIGDYKLKISTSVDINQENSETTLTKYKQLLDCRKKTHYMREDFNDRLKTVRGKKHALQMEVKTLIEKLKAIHSEIPDKYIKPLPEIPEIDFDVEFPEQNLELEKYTSLSEKLKGVRKKKVSIIEESLDPIDEEYEVLLLDESRLKILQVESNISFSSATSTQNIRKTQIIVPEDLMKSLSDNDRIETNWEREMKLMRISKKVYEQDRILLHVKKCFDEIDKELDDLEKERLIINADSIYSEIFQLTLNQELIFLRDFEDGEDFLRRKLEDQVKERIAIQHEMKKLSSMIDQKTREITKIHVNIRELNHKYLSMISENKFAEYLKKIFKRKYKAPKIRDSSTDSSSSELNDSDDSHNDDDDDDGIEDAGDNETSVESEDVHLNYLPENVCPSDCDQELYETAFTMRSERHKLENLFRDERKIIEALKQEVDEELKKLNLLENNFKETQKDLADFLLEKQKKLNDIDMTVVLKFHQLQHMTGNNLARIRDCVVFDKTKLSRLYTRVGELQQDTLDQKIKHKKNQTHLHRMDIDCRHMEAEIKSLKSEIKNEMIKKFGQEISLSSLYEAVLRRMVYDIKADMKEMTKFYDQEIKCVKENYQEQIQVLETLIQDNTEKLSFLTVLEEEQFKLRKILKKKPTTEDEIVKIEQEYQEDLSRLKEILKTQKQQKELFRNDIRNLQLKSRPLPPICPKGKNLKILKLNNDDEILRVKLKEDDYASKVNTRDRLETIFDSRFKSPRLTQSNIVIRRVLSKMLINTSTNSKDVETKAQEMIHEIFSNVSMKKNIAEIRNEIKSNIDEFFDKNSASIMPKNIREIIMDNFNDTMSKMEKESRGVDAGSIQITWDLKPKIDELLDSMSIKRDMNIEITLMKYLKTENGLETAVDYLLSNLSKQNDQEATTALRDYATKTLKEIQHQIEESEPETTIYSSASDLGEKNPRKN